MTPQPEFNTPASSRSVTIWELLLVFLTALLFGLRYFQPTENADGGETLWISFGWSLVITGCSILYALKRINFDHIQKTPWDMAVSLLCGGHILSGLIVYCTEGNKYYAINLTFEWLSLWATWKLLRITCHLPGVKQGFLCGFVGIVFSLTLLGLYQYFIFYPDLCAQVQPLFSEYDQLIIVQNPPAKTLERLQEISKQFSALGLPENKAERDALAQRMFYSTEIFGFFALANTFAGVLAVAAIFSSFTVRGFRSLGNGYYLLVGLGTQMLLIYGIYLTKSRTALVAWTVTISIYLLYIIWIKSPRETVEKTKSNKLQTILIIAGFLAVVGLMFASFNQLDQQVISEAPKSLQYRLEYWTGTWQIIKEHPLLGCGLGQFRPAYLQHKLLGSSEEVKDPHQLLLEVWVNGGILGLAGLVLIGLLCFLALLSLHKLVAHELQDIPTKLTGEGRVEAIFIQSHRNSMMLVYLGQGLSFIVSYIYHLSINESLSEFIFVLLVCFIIWSVMASKFILHEILLIQAGVLSVLVLLIHLQAAGGIGMPAIVQTLFLGICCVIPVKHSQPFQSTSQGKKPAYHLYLAPVVPCLFCVLCLQSALVPHLSGRENFLLAGNTSDSRYREAYLLSAINSSPHQPDFRLAYANLTFEKYKQKQGTLEQFFQALDAVIKADPLNPRTYRQAGTWCDQLYILWKKVAPDASTVKQLVDKTNFYYSRTQQLYPYDGRFMAQHAIFLHESSQNELCREISHLALKIHQTNQANGHVDKILPIETVKQLESFIN